MTDLKLEEKKDESFVSLISVVDEDTLKSLSRVKEIHDTLDSLFTDFEIILVVQRSVQHQTVQDLESIQQKIPCIRYLQLSSNVTTDVIWSAGTENAIGDFVICFDLTHDPIDVISKSVELCKAGNDVVVGTTEEEGTFGYQLVRPLSGWLLRLIDYKLPHGATNFRCLSRRAVNAVMDTGHFYQRFFMQIQKTGYGYVAMPYEELSSRSEKTLIKGITNTFNVMVFNTSLPLRAILSLGFVGSVFALFVSLISLILKFFKDDVVAGWPSTVFIISLFATIQFAILTFISEYLHQIMRRVSHSSEYSIVFEKDSSVMVNLDRINVLESSELAGVNRVQTGRDR